MKLLITLLAVAYSAEAVNNFNGYSNLFVPNISLSAVTFTLYTRKAGNHGIQIFLGDKESIRKSGFDPKIPVKVATHGYMTSANGQSVQSLRKAFHARTECNFISIDWSQYAKNILYEESAYAVKTVGLHVSKFLRFLRDATGIDVKDIHVMGHSLGAQIMSHASKEFPGEKVGRITGFDPAGPIFEVLPPSERLDPSDAIFVDVIHTSIIYLGVRNAVGTVDFYPNSGKDQPGCDKWDFQCQHNVAYLFFSYTIKTGHDYDAVKCNTLKDAENGTCDGPKGLMGIGAIHTKPGIYYVKITKFPDLYFSWEN